MWKTIFQWLKNRPSHVSIGLFFFWGVIMSIFSGGLNTFWGIPILLFTHLISGLGIYFGILKNPLGKRSALGIVLNVVGMVYNLSIDILFVLI